MLIKSPTCVHTLCTHTHTHLGPCWHPLLVAAQVGRLFCPRCGNMTVERVEVSVGPDGAEVYGVRKKHVLRGTRFSLPKPKVGSLCLCARDMGCLVVQCPARACLCTLAAWRRRL